LNDRVEHDGIERAGRQAVGDMRRLAAQCHAIAQLIVPLDLRPQGLDHRNREIRGPIARTIRRQLPQDQPGADADLQDVLRLELEDVVQDGFLPFPHLLQCDGLTVVTADPDSEIFSGRGDALASVMGIIDVLPFANMLGFLNLTSG
jgi:hypothetical protein